MEDFEHAVHGVVDEGEGALLFAAVDELYRLAVYDVVRELREHARRAFLRGLDVVLLGADEVEGAEERELQALVVAVGPDDAVEHLLDARVYPALLFDWAKHQVRLVLVKKLVGAHAVNFGGRGEYQALPVRHAHLDDFHVGLVVEAVDAQGVFHI